MGTTHESTAVSRALSAGANAAPSQRHDTTPRLGPGAFLGELLVGGAYACLLSVALQLLVARLPVSDPGTYVPEALVAVAAATLFGLAYGLPAMRRVRRLPRGVTLVAAWTALSTLATLVLALPLHATRFYLGGASVDNTFRLQYLERAAASPALRDMNYVDLPPYYPAGWFWLGGRVANLLGIPGWEAYKPYAITWCALTAVVAFALYRLVLRGRTAFYAALITVPAGLATAGVGEPYAWPTTAWLPPIAVLTWTALRRRDRPPWWILVLIGVYLGVCGMTYTLHLGFGALLVVVLAALATAFAVGEGRRFGSALAGAAGRVAVIALVAAALAAVVWVPFVAAGGLGLPNPAPRFLPAMSAWLPHPFTMANVFGLLCLIGLVWVVFAAFSGVVALPLAVVVGLVYLWFGLSTLALIGETTLLAFRFVPTIGLTLAVAGVLGCAAGLRRLSRRPEWRRHGRAATVLATVLAVAGSVVLVQDSLRGELSGPVSDAESDYYPTGRTPQRERDPADDAAWTPGLIAAIDDLTPRGPTDQVLLTEQHHLLMFRPYWNFQQLTPHYANPLARYGQRSDEIRSWARARGPEELLRRMRDGPFEVPTVFVLERLDTGEGERLRYTLTADVFPRSSPVAGEPAVFDAAVFDSPRFERRDVGPFAVVAVRP